MNAKGDQGCRYRYTCINGQTFQAILIICVYDVTQITGQNPPLSFTFFGIANQEPSHTMRYTSTCLGETLQRLFDYDDDSLREPQSESHWLTLILRGLHAILQYFWSLIQSTRYQNHKTFLFPGQIPIISVHILSNLNYIHTYTDNVPGETPGVIFQLILNLYFLAFLLTAAKERLNHYLQFEFIK